MVKKIFLIIIMLLFIGTVAWQFMMLGTSFCVEAYPDENGRSSFFSNNPTSRVLKYELQLRVPCDISENIKQKIRKEQEGKVADFYMDYRPVGSGKMCYESCSVMFSDLKPEKNGYYTVQNTQLYNMLKKLPTSEKFLIKLELVQDLCFGRQDNNDSAGAWSFRVHCSEYDMAVNRENINGVTGLISTLDIQKLLKEQETIRLNEIN